MIRVHLHLTCSLFFPSRLELQKLKVDLCRFIKGTNRLTRFSLFLTTKATFFPQMAFDNWKRGHHCVKTVMTFSSCHSSVTECDSCISVAQWCVWVWVTLRLLSKNREREISDKHDYSYTEHFGRIHSCWQRWWPRHSYPQEALSDHRNHFIVQGLSSKNLPFYCIHTTGTVNYYSS